MSIFTFLLCFFSQLYSISGNASYDKWMICNRTYFPRVFQLNHDNGRVIRKKHSLDSGVLKRLLLLLGLSDEEGSSPGPLDSKPAVQCLQAPNALLDNPPPPFFFFLKRKVKILINYTNIFKRNKSRTFLTPMNLIGFQQQKEKYQ